MTAISAAPADVYDADIQDPESLALIPVEHSPWLPLYTEVLRWLPRTAPVVDLGCGTGRLARLLADHGFNDYLGLDFSEAAIQQAAAYVEDDGFTFAQWDLRDLWTRPIHEASVFVCTEVLEHLDDDHALIRYIPNGATLIFSVPSYDSANHVRTFGHVSDVFARYERLIDIIAWRALDFGPVGRRVHLCEATRRADSWS